MSLRGADKLRARILFSADAHSRRLPMSSTAAPVGHSRLGLALTTATGEPELSLFLETYTASSIHAIDPAENFHHCVCLSEASR